MASAVSFIDLAYAAGIVDGEGSIFITEIQPAPDQKRRKSPLHRIQVAVAMSEPMIPAWLSLTFGGTVHSYPGRQPQHKPHIHWALSGPTAVEFCELLLPYLKLKKPQAELAIRFYRERIAGRNRRSRGLPADELAARRELAQQMRTLNRRGVPVEEVV